MIKNNKIIIVLIIFLLLLLVLDFSKVSASYTQQDLAINDEKLFKLIYETEEYKSGNYYLFIARNDITYYKIIFVQKCDNFKCYINNFTGNYTLYYNQHVLRHCYTASQNPDTLNVIFKTTDNHDAFYKASAGIFYANINVYSDNTYTNFFLDVPTLEIAEIAKVEELPTIIIKMMKIIIPIGLAIFGMLLLILLIKLVILRMI